MQNSKYNVGDLVYFVGLDNRCQWAVFGTTIAQVRKQGRQWVYDLNTSPVRVRRDEKGIYRDFAYAKMQAELNSQYNKISPKGAGAPPVRTTTKKRETLRPVDLRTLC